jgi:hypothetical protein
MVLNKRSNGFSSDQRDLFTTLLFVDTLRGKDSTGAMCITNIGNVEMAKQATSAQAFIDTKEYKDLEKTAWERGWAMIGHNRAATRGVVSDENAHPFVVDDKILLVHNGTFHGDHKKLKDTEVDSEAIAHLLAEHSPEEALRKVHAAFALIWYNVEEKKICLIRNNQRPLWYAQTHDTYIIASEESIINFGMERHRMKALEDCGPFLLKENQIVEFELGKDRTTKETSKNVDIDYHKHNPTPVQQHTGGGSAGRPFRGHGHYAGYDWENGDDDPYELLPGGEVVVPRLSPVSTGPVALLPHVKAPTVTREEAWGTKGYFQRKVVGELLGDKVVPFTHEQWHEFTNVHYSRADKIKVVIDDLIEADEDPKTRNFIMIGRTLDKFSVPVVFPMKADLFDAVSKMANEAIFEIDYNGLTWQQVDALKNRSEIIVNDSKGMMLLHGINPKPVVVEGPPDSFC